MSLSSVFKFNPKTHPISFLRQIRSNKLLATNLLSEDDLKLIIKVGNNALIKYERSNLWIPSFSSESLLTEEEFWTVSEQIFLTCLSTKTYDNEIKTLAEKLYSKMEKQFTSESMRVKKLSGMLAEKEGKYEEAEKIYNSILEVQPTNTLVRKRLICIPKAQGNIQKTIELLVVYLETFQADYNAWHELADLYLSVGSYKMATFCYEEMLLQSPSNYLLLRKLGECYYLLVKDNLKMAITSPEKALPKKSLTSLLITARKYYCKSLELCQNINNRKTCIGLVTICYELVQLACRDEDAVNKSLCVYAMEILNNFESTEIFIGKDEHLKSLYAEDMLQMKREAVMNGVPE